MICVDTEDDTKGTVTIINFYDGVHHRTFTGSECQYKAWGYLKQISPVTIWAVNLEYDLVNIFGKWLGWLCTLQYVKAGIMRGIFRLSKITFLDTLRHWPASVERMGKIIGLPKLEMPHIGCCCDDCVIYCRRDTEITWRFVAEMLSRYKALGLESIRSTLPSMAFQLFRQFYIKEFPKFEDYQLDFMRRGYYGGRVEVYRLGKILGETNHYDVNSLFPSVMKDFSYPVLDSFHMTYNPNFNNEGIFDGWVRIPEMDIPCLPVREDEILFPYGGVYGVWPYPEIRQLLSDGGSIIKCKEAIEFDDTENPFDSYVDFCYGKRLQSKNDLDKEFWKLMLNSLYGKFGQNSDLEIIYNNEEKIISTKSKQANVIWSAYVTSYARLRLLHYLRNGETYYTDTDSIFTPKSLPTSTDLGELKLVGTYREVNFKGNKLYLLEDSARAKGVPRKYAGDFIRTGKATFRRPARFRESRRTLAKANHWYEVEKKMKKEYTKRRVLKNGYTEPWNLTEYKKWIREK